MNLSIFFRLPEIPPDDASNNSLFRLDEYPDFQDNPAVKSYFALGKRMLEFESSMTKLDAEISGWKFNWFLVNMLIYYIFGLNLVRIGLWSNFLVSPF
jgi:hypothetical protein